MNEGPGQRVDDKKLRLALLELEQRTDRRCNRPAGLLGLSEGARVTFEVPAGEAFGERNPELVQWVGRKLLNELGDPDERYHAGDVVQFPTPDGMGQYAGAVQQVKADGTAVQFDFNHPLAGQAVVFEVHVIGVI